MEGWPIQPLGWGVLVIDQFYRNTIVSEAEVIVNNALNSSHPRRRLAEERQ